MTYCYTKILRVFKESQRNVSQNSGANRRGSFGSSKDNCIVKFRSKLQPNHNRRRSLPSENPANSESQTLSTNIDCGCYGNANVAKPATTGMIRKNRPVTSFQPLNTQTSKMVSSNTNNAHDGRSNSSFSSSNGILENGAVISPPMSPEYTKRDASLDLRQSKRWKSPFKRSKEEKKSSRAIAESISGIQPDTVSTDDFSNPFANSVSVVDLAAQAAVNGNHHQRAVPRGLYGTPNGPSSSRMARKKKRREEEMRLTKSFIVVIFVFILCWFPFCITMFWSVFSRDGKTVPRPIDMATLILGFANSCCNPIIYGVMNRKFRAGFKSILCWWKDHNVVNPWKPPPGLQP